MLERILTPRSGLCLLGRRMKMLDRLALDENRIWSFSKNGFDRQLVAHAHVAHRTTECFLVGQGFIPETTQRREAGADEDLVDRSVVTHPRIATRKGARVIGKQHWERWILKPTQPIRNSEVTKVGNQLDTLIAKGVNRLIAAAPVELVGCDVSLVVG